MATELKNARIYYGNEKNGYEADYTEFASLLLARDAFKNFISEDLPSGWDVDEDVEIDYNSDDNGGMTAHFTDKEGNYHYYELVEEGWYDMVEQRFGVLRKEHAA